MGAIFLQACGPNYLSAVGPSDFIAIGCAGGMLNAADELQIQTTWRTAGVFSNGSISISANSLSASAVLDYRKATINGNTHIVIASGATGTFTDITHTESVSAGDQVNFRFLSGLEGTGTSDFETCSIQFTPTTTTNTVNRLGCNGTFTDTSVNTSYFNPLTGDLNASTTEANTQFKNKTAATLQNLYGYVSNNTVSVATIDTRIGGVNGNLTLSISSGATGVFEDTTHTDSVSPGDLLNTAFNSTLTTSITVNNIALEYLTTSYKTQYFCGQGANVVFPAGITRSLPLAGSIFNTGLPEALAQATPGLTFTASNLESFVVSNGLTATTTTTFRVASANGNQSISYTSGATGYVEDSTHTDSVSSVQAVNYRSVIGGTGTNIVFGTVGILASYPVPEVLTCDKWLPVLPDTAGRKARSPVAVGHFTQPTGVFPNEATSVDKYEPIYPDRIKIYKPNTPVGYSVQPVGYTLAEFPDIDKWQPKHPDKIDVRKPLVPTGYAVQPVGYTATETISPDKWLPVFPDTAGRKAKAPFHEGISYAPVYPLPKFVNLAIDGTATGSALAGNPAQITFSNTKAQDIIILYALTGAGVLITGITDTAGLKWSKRGSTFLVGGINGEIWWAPSPGILTSDVISITYASAASPRIIVYGVNGAANLTAPFDTNVSFPAVIQQASGTSATNTVTTNSTNTMLLGFVRSALAFTTQPEPTGFTTIATSGSTSTDTNYKLLSAAAVNSAVTLNWTTSGADPVEFILDAIAGQTFPVYNWEPSFPDRTSYAPRPLVAQGLTVSATGYTSNEATAVDKWQPSYPDKAYARTPLVAEGQQDWNNWQVPVLEVVTLDKYLPSYPDRVYAKKPLVPEGYSVQATGYLLAEFPDIDKWHPTYPDKIDARKPLVQEGKFSWQWFEVITPDKWHAEYPNYIWRKLMPYYQHPAVRTQHHWIGKFYNRFTLPADDRTLELPVDNTTFILPLYKTTLILPDES